MCTPGGAGRPVAAESGPASPRGGAASAGAACGGLGIEAYIDRIAEELHERVEHQRRVLKQVVGGGGAADRAIGCPFIDCPRLSQLTKAVQETIDVLEETRSAFKSKRLEVTRKRLIDILAGR